MSRRFPRLGDQVELHSWNQLESRLGILLGTHKYQWTSLAESWYLKVLCGEVIKIVSPEEVPYIIIDGQYELINWSAAQLQVLEQQMKDMQEAGSV